MGRLRNNGGKVPTGDIAKLGPPPKTGSNDARQRDLDDPRHPVGRRRDSLLAGQAGTRVSMSQPVAPPFDPDPELIDHLEGNRRSLKGYRSLAERLRMEARRR